MSGAVEAGDRVRLVGGPTVVRVVERVQEAQGGARYLVLVPLKRGGMRDVVRDRDVERV